MPPPSSLYFSANFPLHSCLIMADIEIATPALQHQEVVYCEGKHRRPIAYRSFLLIMRYIRVPMCTLPPEVIDGTLAIHDRCAYSSCCYTSTASLDRRWPNASNGSRITTRRYMSRFTAMPKASVYMRCKAAQCAKMHRVHQSLPRPRIPSRKDQHGVEDR